MTYEYACTACGHAWEAEQSISAAPLTECPHCHQANAKRQISGGAGFILKGGGWYADLYSSSGAAKATPESSASSAADSKPKTETKTTTETSSAPAAPAAPAKASTGAAST
jgi:putative FmdB family regulatory protein